MVTKELNSELDDKEEKDEYDLDLQKVDKNEQLKRIPLLLSSSKLCERRDGFMLLDSLLADGVTENVIKGIAYFLVSLIPNYLDRSSQHRLLNSIGNVIEIFGVLCKSTVVAAFSNHAKRNANNFSYTSSISHYHFFHFEAGCRIWSMLAVTDLHLDIDEKKSFIEALSVYYSLSILPNDAKRVKKLSSSLDLLMRSLEDEETFCKIFSDENASIPTMIFGSWTLCFWSKSDFVPPTDVKSNLIKAYVNNVLTSKKKPNDFVILKSSALISLLSCDEFANVLHPVAQKSILRNPEVILRAIGLMFSQLKFDLSRFVKDYIKVLENPLHAAEDSIRDDAVFTCEQLVKKTKDSSGIRAFINLINDIFNGVYGKLTANSHKLSLIQCLEKISKHGVTNEKECYLLSEEVSNNLMKILEVETHEGSLVQCLSALTSWASKFKGNLPEKVTAFLPKGLALKTSTTEVKAGYFRFIFSCITQSNVSKFSSLVSMFSQMLDKSLCLATQIPSLTEALAICTCIVKLCSYDPSLKCHMDGLWSSALDKKKNFFIAEKFLNQVSVEGLLQLVSLSELLISHCYKTMTAELDQAKYGLVWCLCCSQSSVRFAAQMAVKSLCQGSAGNILAVDLISVMPDVVANLKSQNREFDDSSANGLGNEVCVKGISSALMWICSLKHLPKKIRQQLGMLTTSVVFHPAIDRENKDLFGVLCKLLNISSSAVFRENKTHFLQVINESISKPKLISGVCRYGGKDLYPLLIPQVIENLRDPLLNAVTDEEIAIFRTPEGVLYNQNALDQVFESELSIKNVKKSTKVYSHKEQVMMLEEKKKEMEKKRREGKLDLTPRQKEVMKIELEKESAIRRRISCLDEKTSKAATILEAAIKGDTKRICAFHKTMLPVIIELLPSKLIGSRLGRLFYDIKSTCFDGKEDLFASAIGRTTLRVYECSMEFPIDWTGESVQSSAFRVIEQFQRITSPVGDSDDNHFTAPGFVYCLPLLEWAIENSPADLTPKVDTMVVNIIKNHVSMRASCVESLYHPQHLSRERILELLIRLISTRDGRIQQMACAVLQDVCMCASGQAGCDRASKEEIMILLETLTAPAQSVRDASLRGLSVLIDSLPNLSINVESVRRMSHRLWVARHDEDDGIREIATLLWTNGKMKVEKNLQENILDDVTHSTQAVRVAAGASLATLVEQENLPLEKIINKLVLIYRRKLEMTPAKKDQYDRVVEEAIDHWEGRSGVALALLRLAPLLQEKNIISLAKFFVPDSLSDRHEIVRNDMLDAALALVNQHGRDNVGNLLPVFEKFMSNAPNQAKYDAVKQSVVILMGSLAKHLDQSSPKIKPIVTKLIEALYTPSQQVQEAASQCLHPLIPAVKEDCPAIVSKLMHALLEYSNYGQRKGAAYGLASVVKGLGILSLKQLDIMNKLTQSIQDKKVNRYREGSLFAIEQLCNMLGKLFEPYIVHILPHLLVCFGDSNIHVRQAADDTAKAVMSKLSAHGVKLVLPSLLAALEEDSWRTKSGSIELLGNMAFCAPKQLSSCLPSIVPRLIDILSDSHLKVQTAGAEALKLIGSVIRNPEIQAIVPVLLDALQEPGPNTSICLQTLLETKFVHFIDSPSLALIMPVVQRAFQDRSTEVRKMAAQIIGNMYSLTDQKDLAPYLPSIIPGLKASLLDPVPKVRSVSARALGAMVKGMGESSFDDLLPWLMQTLTSEASPVDRSGAAQGLAEVVGGLGTEKLHRLMPDIVATAERSDIAPHVKDGYIMMFIFLPTVFEEEFTPYIGQIISPILKALADENEFVRDTALRAGQRIVNTYASSAVTLLLPELENGLFHDNWRIRFSSVQLLGDLLYRVSGVSGKMTTDTAHEDDNFGTEHSQKAIMEVLGEERRNRVLAGLYMGRSDVALLVRQATLHVWKVVVTNTPKTLREILPTLFSLLLSCLASTSYDKRQVAARTLGDLVRKLGERVLPEIIPILEAGLDSPEADHRQGVCIGLSEIMASTSKDMVLSFTNNLVPTVRRALCDPLPTVREAAAHTFDSLHSTVGSKALDDILPHLLNLLDDPTEKEFALDGLKQVMAVKSRVVLPYLIPRLTSPPIKIQALCILSSAAGESLTKYLNKILPALLGALSNTSSSDEFETILTDCQEVVLAVNDDLGVSSIIDELLSYTKNKNEDTSRAAVSLLFAFCSNTSMDYTDYASQLIRGLIQLLVSSDKITLQTAWNALNAVTKSLDPSDQRLLVADVRQAVKFAASDLKGLYLIPGFCLPKGIQPILPIFREAVLNGEPDQKEAASNGLTEVIRLTSADALKTSVVHITGPLIRILGDRFNWNVKVAVLDTLALLLEKTGPMLKPFLPQLQTTFVKAVNDPQRIVRLKAGNALSHLIIIHTKPDPLFSELHNLVKSSEDPLVRETMLQAVRLVVSPCGNRMSEAVCKGLLGTLTSLLFHDSDSIRLCTAGVLGSLLQWLSESDAEQLISNHILGDLSNQELRIAHGKSCALFCALKSAPTQLLSSSSEERVAKALLQFLSSENTPIALNGVTGVGFFMKHLLKERKIVPAQIISVFSKMINHQNNDVKQTMCRASQYVAENVSSEQMGDGYYLPEHVSKPILPMLVNGTKEKNPVVRSAAEMALIAILRMNDTTDVVQNMLDMLDEGARDSLSETVNKTLKKTSSSYSHVTENEIDPSILT